MSFDTTTPSLAASSEAGYTFDLHYPDGTPVGATITVRGPESAPVRALLRTQIAMLASREESARLGRKKAPAARTLDDIESDLNDLAAAYTIGWTGIVTGGAPIPATDANVRALYAAHSWIRAAVIAEAQDLGNFARPTLQPSSTTPAPSSAST